VMINKWNLPAPNLVVSLVGEEENFQMKPWLRDTLRKGLVKAAQSTGAWILTSALHVGITRHIGQAVRDHNLASTSSTVRVIAIGITSLWKIQHREILDNAKNEIHICYKSDNTAQGPPYSLDNNHSHFILVDQINPDEPDGTTKLRLTLEKHISEQRTGYGGSGSIEIPVICLLVNGGPTTFERMCRGLENSAPWLILAGSGGAADILAALMNEPHLIVPQVVETQFKEKFPMENFSWKDILKWTAIVSSFLGWVKPVAIYEFSHIVSTKVLIYLYFLFVVACKSHSQEAQEYLDELKLAVAWNRVDIAKSEIFNGDVEWKSCDLEEVMMDALVNDKPEFVKLFIDNGANMYDFLTYSRLQRLYCSVSQKCLLYALLLKKHEENRLSLAGPSGQQHKEVTEACPLFTLHEVSRVLKDFLHDACKGFYQDEPRGKGDKINAKRLPGLLDMNQKSENPWRDLFLWAVLQNRHKMANYFWAMGQEGVAAALAACKILKEMCRLETEAEVARRMKEAKYEQLAMELFSECYHNSEDRAFALLVRKNRYWSKTTCLHLATEADAKCFFAHDGVQAFLTKIWWGDMSTCTPILKLICGFWCPLLIYTNLISFSEEKQSMDKSQPFKELDSLDTERILLFPKEGDFNLEMQNPSENVACAAFEFTRWNKFWSAPVTVFMGNVIMYFAFLFLFAYVLLLDFTPPPPEGPSVTEIILYFWVFTLVLEEIRQSFFTDEDMNLMKKFKLYVEDNWNKCDMVAIFLFIMGVICRMLNSTFQDGRTILAIDFMVFTLRLIHIFAIHKQLGPKIIIVERMMKDVFFFLFFLSVWLIAYGVTTQALLHPTDGRVEWIFRRVLYRPYLQIFGQIPLDEIDTARMRFGNCTENPLESLQVNSPSCPNSYANWLVILLLVIFLLVTNVLLMNLLIAMFSYTFQVVQGNADIFWKFQRYNLIVEYHGRPALAPPFIILNHMNVILRKIFKKTEHKKEHLERDLPDGLDQKIITWEAVQKENYLANLEEKKKESNEEILKKTSNKVDSLTKYFRGLKEQEKRLKSLESQVRKELGFELSFIFSLLKVTATHRINIFRCTPSRCVN
uniref:Transient receptor potential cation channel subfamily M member 5 n=1 Tax=Sphenodon punctatus TaxID=8508 RepID=A0A8D0GBQ5_SPHPU